MKYSFTIFILIWFFSGFSQNIKSPKVIEHTQKELVKILSSVQSFSHEQGKKLGINFFRIDNGSGSAYVDGNDESSESLLLIVGDYDSEYPHVRLFSIGPFYGLKITHKADHGDSFVFYTQTVVKGKKEYHTITVSLNNIIYH